MSLTCRIVIIIIIVVIIGLKVGINQPVPGIVEQMVIWYIFNINI